MVLRLRAVVLLCAAVTCCTSSPEVEAMEDGPSTGRWNVLLQEGVKTTAKTKGATDDLGSQPGSPISPRGTVGKCVTAVNEEIVLEDCNPIAQGQNWFYDRVSGGTLSTVGISVDEVVSKVCLTRSDGSVIVAPCAIKESESKLQKWELMCGAIGNLDVESNEGRVLKAVGTKVFAVPWVGSPTQLFDYDEYMAHDKCSDKADKVMDFVGSRVSAAQLTSFAAMPSEVISVSAWVNASEGSVFSYGTSKHPGAFALNNVKSLAIMINDVNIPTGVSVANLGWVHLTVQWSSVGGEVSLFLNGRSSFNKLNVSVGESIVPGGCLMLAQQQSRECTPTSGEALLGQVSDFQIRSKVLDSGQIQNLMKYPMDPDKLKKMGHVSSPPADKELKLSLLTRQYASQELGIASPPVCDLTPYAPPKPGAFKGEAGTMGFSVTGAGHYKTFTGCRYNTQGVGEYAAVVVKQQFHQAAPLTIQFRTNLAKSNCAWCKNGIVSYIDGCAVKYGKDQASASFGGFEEGSTYPAFAAMNGKAHQGWKYSASNMMQVNIGKDNFEAVVNDGTYVKCSPRSLYINLPKKYAGKINGLAGSGVKATPELAPVDEAEEDEEATENAAALSDWAAGPNQAACPKDKCTVGKPVENTEGICHNHFTSSTPADPFNGNAFTKPIVFFANSWQVDGNSVPSVFYYEGEQEAGSLNPAPSTATQPVLEINQNVKGNAEATKACRQFYHTNTTMQKCVFDYNMVGPSAVGWTQEDLERGLEARVNIPTQKSIRDTSRYRNVVNWLAEPSWACEDRLKDALTDLRSEDTKKGKPGGFVVPVEGNHIFILLDQAHAVAVGLSKAKTGFLQFSEIEIYVADDMEPVIPEEIVLLSPGEPLLTYPANNCLDKNKKTDCKTAVGKTAMIRIRLAAEQEIVKIVITDSKDKRAEGRNIGATVMITSNSKMLNPSWQSPPFKEQQSHYTFEPVLQFHHSNMTESVTKDFGLWKWKPDYMHLENNTIEIPPEQILQTRAKYDPTQYFLASMDIKKTGPGPVSVTLFSPECTQKRGFSLVLNKEEKNLKIRTGQMFKPVHNISADFTKLQHIDIQVYNQLLTIHLNGDLVYEAMHGARKTAPMCVQAGVGPLFISDVNVRFQAAAGTKNIAAETKLLAAETKRFTKAGKVAKQRMAAAEKPMKNRIRKMARAAKRKADREEAAEMKQKAKDKISAELAHKQEMADCAVKKMKEKARKATMKKLASLTFIKNKLGRRKKASDRKIAAEIADLALQKKNVKDSGENIHRIVVGLVSAQTNVTKAFEIAKNSLQIFKAHSAAARANSSTHLGGSGTTSEHEEYLRQAAALREMHRSKAASITLLHESRLRMVAIKSEMIESNLKHEEVLKEVAGNALLITSLGPIEADEDEKGNNCHGPNFDEKSAPLMTMGEMVQKLAVTTDVDDAFELTIRMKQLALKGTKGPTPLQQQILKKKHAEAAFQIQQIQEERLSLSNSDQNPEAMKAQNELAAAEKSKDVKRLAKAKTALKKAMTLTTADLTHMKRMKELKALEEKAKKKGDSAAAVAVAQMMATANSQQDPGSADFKVFKLTEAYERALKGCGGKADNPEVVALKQSIIDAQGQAAAEKSGQEVDAMIAGASSGKSTGEKAQGPDPKVKSALETAAQTAKENAPSI